jgi:hypothetical protein
LGGAAAAVLAARSSHHARVAMLPRRKWSVSQSVYTSIENGQSWALTTSEALIIHSVTS